MICILSALKDEVAPVISEMEVLERLYLRPSVIVRGSYLKKDVVVAHTGIGPEKMKRGAEFCLKEFKPDICINIGYCGALVPELSVGDVVIASNVIDEKSERQIPANADLPALPDSDAGIRTMTGNIVTVGKPCATPHEKAFLGTKFGAIAVDMESFAMGDAAEKLGIKFAVARAVFDPLDMHITDLPDFVTPEGDIDPLKLGVGLIKRPQNIGKLPQLKFCADKARAAFIRFIDHVIKNYQ